MTEDQDPTGMRHLLAGLKESGPMPDDLAERIRTSLEDEQAARAAGISRDDDDGTGPDDGETSSFWSTMSAPGDGPRRRRSAAPWLLGAAAATVLALGIGTFMLDRTGSDTADSSASSNAQADGAAESTASGTLSDSTDSRSVPAFAITQSGTDYTRSSVASAAGDLLKDPSRAPEVKDDSALGTLTTAGGASDCLARLGEPGMQAAVVDVASFEGKDGLLLIAESVPDGPARAWAITSGCEKIWPDPVEVPAR